MQSQRKHPRLTLKDVFAAIGVVSTALALQTPAVIAFKWGVENLLLATVILVLLGLGGLALLALRSIQQPESREP
jgi:uncharacterized YccA/Bax inhibitor family protein